MAGQCNGLLAGFLIAVSIMPFQLSEAVNYNRETQTCCRAIVLEKGNYTGCCGMGQYDATEALCCGDQVFPFRELGPAGFPWKHGCCYSSSGGAKPFDMDSQQCCDGEVLDNPDKKAFYACCSGKLYNAVSQRCCDEQLHDQAGGNECCADKIYNTSTQMCCQRWKRNGDKVVREFAILHQRQDPQSSCCAEAVYDTTKEVCCSDKILPKPDGIDPNDALCCEGRVVDNRKQLCCRDYSNVTAAAEGRAFDRDGLHSRCCGPVAIDIRHQVCCNDSVLPKPAGMDEDAWGTCCGDQIQTSFRSQLCINDKLVERNSTDLWNCGDEGKLYNIHSQTCCYGKILENDDDMRCCHSVTKSYNSKKEICCGGGIQSLTAEDIEKGKFDCCE